MSGRNLRRTLVTSALGGVAAVALAAGAVADSNQTETFRFGLAPVPHNPTADNGSHVTGTGELSLQGRRVSIEVTANGLDALPHPMHIHGKGHKDLAFCPGSDRRDDLVNDGLIETVEGIEDYGPVQVSLTTTGDTSAASALALDRFPTANAAGVLTYERTFWLPGKIASDIDEKHIVIHGEDLNNDGMYGGRITALGAPLEAELPVACGRIAG